MSSYIPVATIEEVESAISKNTGCLIFFTTNSCSVGEALEDKILHTTRQAFPGMLCLIVDINNSTALAAKFQVFVEPTLLIFLHGKETVRKSRNISLLELEKTLKRYYTLIFN